MFIVIFQGGLANQLFQFAFYLMLKEKYPSFNVYADTSFYKKHRQHSGYMLSKCKEIKYIYLYNKKNNVSVNEINFSKLKYEKSITYIFSGYWQDTIYFPDNINPIKNYFSFKLSKKNKDALDKISTNNSTSVHIRRGDYINNYMHGNISTKVFFQNAINYILKNDINPFFFIFSDDIEWVKDNITFYNKNNVLFINWNNGKDCIYDLFLMSKCNNNIISNSSFSWWAQYLNSNKNKKVISPEYWFNQYINVKPLYIENAITLKNVPVFEYHLSHPFFSIIIPVYNTSIYLKRCLSSVLNQTFNNFEVILVNDHSSDDSLDIIKEYTTICKNIIVLNNDENKGLVYTRIKGIKAAVGEYFLFLDSDDYLDLNALDILYKHIQLHNTDIVEFGFVFEPEKKEKGPYSNISLDNRIFNLLTNKIFPTIWNKAYKSSMIKKCIPYFITDLYLVMFEDTYFSLYYYHFSESISFLNFDIIHYLSNTGVSTTKYFTLNQFKQTLIQLHNLELNIFNIINNLNINKYSDLIKSNIESKYELIICKALNSKLDIKDIILILLELDNDLSSKASSIILLKLDQLNSNYIKYINLSTKKKILFHVKEIYNIFINKIRRTK